MRTLRMKMVMIMVILILALMTVIGAFLISGVGNFYISEFYVQMERTFSPEFITQLQDLADGENGPTQMKELLMAQTGLGIDVNDRNVYILDSLGQVLEGSDERTQVSVSQNLLTAMNDEVGQDGSVTGEFMDLAVPIVTDEHSYIAYIYDNRATVDALTSELMSIILRALGLASPLKTVSTAFACILVFALLRGVLRYAEQASNHYIAFRLLALIRDKVFGALRRLTPAKLEGRDRGDLISLITADIEALEVFYAHTISPVCIAVLWAAGMTAFTAHWHILPALALLAGYLLVGAALPVWSAKRGQAVAREYRQALADTNSYVLESLRGLRDTLQYQDTAARAAGITAHSETLGAKQTALKYREGLIVAVTNTLILFTTLAVLGVSLWLYQRGELAAQGVLVCTLTALSSFGPVVALANLGAGLTQVFASADRVLALLDEAPVTPEVTDGENTPFAGAEVRNVSFGYAGEQVLREISLTIPEKKIVGITGRSGSGKSTLLRLLMRFWDVQTGSIRFGAEDIRRVNTAALRAQESLVTQETELFADTIGNNIRIAKRDAAQEEVEAACKKAALDDFIRSLPKGYDTPVGELGGTLSGGERQRIGVARAFLHDAPFLLLDEPTSNLDSLNEGIILRAVRAECKDRTVLLVSHRKSTMAAADVSFSVESGRVS